MSAPTEAELALAREYLKLPLRVGGFIDFAEKNQIGAYALSRAIWQIRKKEIRPR